MKPLKCDIEKVFCNLPITKEILLNFIDMDDYIPKLFWKNINFCIKNANSIHLMTQKDAQKRYEGFIYCYHFYIKNNTFNVSIAPRCTPLDPFMEDLNGASDEKMNLAVKLLCREVASKNKNANHLVIIEDGNLSALLHEIQHVRQFAFLDKYGKKITKRMPNSLKTGILNNRLFFEYINFAIEFDAYQADALGMPCLPWEIRDLFVEKFDIKGDYVSKHKGQDRLTRNQLECIADSYQLSGVPVVDYFCKNPDRVNTYILFRCPPDITPKRKFKDLFKVCFWNSMAPMIKVVIKTKIFKRLGI